MDNSENHPNGHQKEPLDLTPRKKPKIDPKIQQNDAQEEPLDLSPTKRVRIPNRRSNVDAVIEEVVNEGPRRMEAVNALLEMSCGLNRSKPRCICSPGQQRVSVITGNCYVVLHFTIITRNPLQSLEELKNRKKRDEEKKKKLKENERGILGEIIKLLKAVGHFSQC